MLIIILWGLHQGFNLVATAYIWSVNMKSPESGSRNNRPARIQSPARLKVLGVLAGGFVAAWWVGQPTRRPTTHLARSRWIDALPEQVFAAVTDPRKPFLTENRAIGIHTVGERTEGVGTVYRWSFRLPFGIHFGFDETVTAWEPGARFAYKAVAGWDMAAETRLDPEAGGSRVTFTMDCRLPGPLVLLPQWAINLGADLALASLARQTQRAQPSKDRDKYMPAFRYRWLTPFYDFAQRWIFRESIFKAHLVEQARIEQGYRVLDLGCGTATLTILIKQTHPEAEVVGLDGDTEALKIAESKAALAGARIAFDHGMAFELPYADGSFDRVISSLMFHHLTTQNKYRAMREVLRVLRPAGEFHLADLGKPHTPTMYLISLIVGRIEESADNVWGLLPKMILDAGFEQVEEIARFTTPYGTVSSLRARKT